MAKFIFDTNFFINGEQFHHHGFTSAFWIFLDSINQPNHDFISCNEVFNELTTKENIHEFKQIYNNLKNIFSTAIMNDVKAINRYNHLINIAKTQDSSIDKNKGFNIFKRTDLWLIAYALEYNLTIVSNDDFKIGGGINTNAKHIYKFNQCNFTKFFINNNINLDKNTN